MVREVSALGNIPERNPFELRANDHLVNMYIRISPGDRRLKQTVQKNLVVLVIARNYRLSSVSSRFWAYCFPSKSFIPVSSWLICRTGVVFRVFHSGGQMQEESAKGESLAQKKKNRIKKSLHYLSCTSFIRNKIMTSFHAQFATSEYNENRICLPISTSLANLELVSHNWTP